jgi:hypothetical protein
MYNIIRTPAYRFDYHMQDGSVIYGNVIMRVAEVNDQYRYVTAHLPPMCKSVEVVEVLQNEEVADDI